MGRPALNVKQITVYLPLEMIARIDAQVGPNARSVFIRQALGKALDEAEKIKPPA